MKKVFTLLLWVCQTALFAQNSFECGFDSARLQLQNQDTNWYNNQPDYLAPIYDHLNNLQVPQPKNNTGKLNKTTPAIQARFVIPVVIHVLHKNSDYAVGMGSNISDSQILHQLNHLNRAFRNADEADSLATNTGIQFCLANKELMAIPHQAL